MSNFVDKSHQFFAAVQNKIPQKLHTTSGYRFSNGAQVALECANDIVTPFTSITELPSKITQIGVAGFALFRRDTKFIEKSIQLTMVSCLLAQTILTLLFYFLSTQCENDESALCKTAYILDLTRRGILLLAFVSGELSQAPATIHHDHDSEDVIDSIPEQLIPQTGLPASHNQTQYEEEALPRQIRPSTA